MLEELLARLEGAAPWKIRASCVSAAERVAPLFRAAALRESVEAFEGALEAAWSAVRTGRTGGAARGLRRLPEANVDDSHRSDYVASLALLVLTRAIAAAARPSPGRAASCLEEVVSLCDGIDTTLTAAPGEAFIYDPKNPPPPGALERRELAAQADVLLLLESAASPSDEVVGALRRIARARGASCAAAAGRLARRRSPRARR